MADVSSDSENAVPESQSASGPVEPYEPVDVAEASAAAVRDVPIVPDGKIAALPFTLLNWEDFERLIVALAIDADHLTDVRRYGRSGQAQDGVDIVGFTRDGRRAHVYQCKKVKEFTESQLADAIARFAGGRRPFGPQRLVIAVATAANRTRLMEDLETAQRREPDLDLDLWDAPRLDDLLRQRPGIVEQFFGEDASRRFCLSASFPQLACGAVHRRLTAGDTREFLAEPGRSQRKPGLRRRIARHAALALVALVVVAGAAVAADRIRNSPGVPEYYQTGSGAGIRAGCENGTALDGLISPREDAFTDVSLWRRLTLDGRSAFVMRGTYHGTISYWIVSDFNAYGMPDLEGTPGATQIRWWVSGGTRQYCTVSFLSAPPKELAREGIQQVATMAVPDTINGKPVFFQACIWYKPQVTPDSQCWSV